MTPSKQAAHVSIIVLCTLIVYWLLPYGFFQQDEWGIFGNSIYRLLTYHSFFGLLRPFSGFSHFTPVTTILNISSLKLFGIHYEYYALYAVVNQALNSILVYILAKTVTRNTTLALIAGVIFSSYGISHQATTWLATNVGTQGATFFLLLSAIFFSRYMLLKRSLRDLALSYVFFVISVGTKENTAFLVVFYSLIVFLAEKKGRIFVTIKTLAPLYLFILIYAIGRILLSFNAPPTAGTVEQLSQPSIAVYAFRSIALPLRAISQVFIPETTIIAFSNGLITIAYPQFLVDKTIPDPPIAQSAGVDTITAIAAGIVLVAGVLLYRLLKEPVYKKLLVVSFLFIITSVLPLIFIPGRAGYFTLYESRELYFAGIGASMVLAIAVLSLARIRAAKRWFPQREYIIAGIITAILLIINVKTIRTHLYTVNARGAVRKNILTTIRNTYPTLPQKTVVYAESDSSFYGLPATEPILPFQSGFGQTILIWYFIQGEAFPACFFDYQYDFLYNIYSQGYKECGGRGFGYFRKMDDLRAAVRDNQLPPGSIIGFRYVSKTNSLIDITQTLREQL